MDRPACVDLHALPLQLLLRDHEEWRELPVAVVDKDSPMGVLLWVNEKAWRSRLRPGLRYAAALSINRDLRAGTVSAAAIASCTDEVLEKLRGFSPRIEPVDAEPGVFRLDASGLSLLYPDIRVWGRNLQTRLEGLLATVVVGFTRFAVYAVARAARSGALIVFERAEQERRTAGRVPLERLPLAPELRDRLAALGIRTLADFLRLPADGLQKRFGRQAFDLYKEAEGSRGNFLEPLSYEEPLTSETFFDEPVTDAASLLFYAKRMLGPLLEALAERGQTLAEITLGLVLDRPPSGRDYTLLEHACAASERKPPLTESRPSATTREHPAARRNSRAATREIAVTDHKFTEAAAQISATERKHTEAAAKISATERKPTEPAAKIAATERKPTEATAKIAATEHKPTASGKSSVAARQRAAAGRILEERLSPAAPTLDLTLIVDLLRLRLETLQLERGAVEMTLAVCGAEASREQLRLFTQRPRRDLAAADRALARLRAELGEDALLRAELREGHLPEAGFAWVLFDRLEQAAPRNVKLRPLVRRILARPDNLPIPVRPHRERDDLWMEQSTPHGRIERLIGPYVVSGGWWIKEVHREYHFALTARGELLWIYHDKRRRRWFIHGWVE